MRCDLRTRIISNHRVLSLRLILHNLREYHFEILSVLLLLTTTTTTTTITACSRVVGADITADTTTGYKAEDDIAAVGHECIV